MRPARGRRAGPAGERVIMNTDFTYIVVGGGIAGASAIEGIREHDREGSILLVTRENSRPYRRPPLSKDLWSGKLAVGDIAIHDDDFYVTHGVELLLRREVVELDPVQNRIWDDRGTSYRYDKLLLATGGRPRLLDLRGEQGECVHYFRTLEDYLMLAGRLDQLQHLLVVGGGFIGLELTAALVSAGKEVTLLMRDEYPLSHLLPRDLGLAVAEYFRERGVETVSNQAIAALERGAGLVQVRTLSGDLVTTQMVLAGVGLEPHDELAEAGGLETGDGIQVDEYCRTSDPYSYAAGDVAEFPCVALGRRARIEHEDHAIHHGRTAGANMAGARRIYDHQPMFFGDLFDLGFEAVGEIDARLDTDAVWRTEHREGLVFYLRDDVVRGVLLWGRFGMVDWARQLVREGKPTTHAERVAMANGAHEG
jgi:NADPH-dependent 2,4-dienoyl-CoA reductase/sulfur reductase-like enzyme